MYTHGAFQKGHCLRGSKELSSLPPRRAVKGRRKVGSKRCAPIDENVFAFRASRLAHVQSDAGELETDARARPSCVFQARGLPAVFLLSGYARLDPDAHHSTENEQSA
eukprot:8993080-Pyramimonas_sp.AAC.1